MLGIDLAPRRDALRVLAIGAHADDIEIGCAATLMRIRASYPRACLALVVFSARGDRAVEARESAQELIGETPERGEVITLDLRDGFFPAEVVALKEAFEGLKAQAPDLILTHRLDDAHQDHRLVAETTWQTFRDHAILEYEVPKYDGDLGRPNLYVPVDEELADRKVDHLMRHFASQHERSWYTPETFRAILRLRGVEAGSGAPYAEAFIARKVSLRLDSKADHPGGIE